MMLLRLLCTGAGSFRQHGGVGNAPWQDPSGAKAWGTVETECPRARAGHSGAGEPGPRLSTRPSMHRRCGLAEEGRPTLLPPPHPVRLRPLGG